MGLSAATGNRAGILVGIRAVPEGIACHPTPSRRLPGQLRSSFSTGGGAAAVRRELPTLKASGQGLASEMRHGQLVPGLAAQSIL